MHKIKPFSKRQSIRLKIIKKQENRHHLEQTETGLPEHSVLSEYYLRAAKALGARLAEISCSFPSNNMHDQIKPYQLESTLQTKID